MPPLRLLLVSQEAQLAALVGESESELRDVFFFSFVILRRLTVPLQRRLLVSQQAPVASFVGLSESELRVAADTLRRHSNHMSAISMLILRPKRPRS